MLNLTGFARNLASGQVEIEAQGEALQLETFVRQLEAGPSGAYVRAVESIPMELLVHEEAFIIR